MADDVAAVHLGVAAAVAAADAAHAIAGDAALIYGSLAVVA